jgi:hypothetical protein
LSVAVTALHERYLVVGLQSTVYGLRSVERW